MERKWTKNKDKKQQIKLEHSRAISAVMKLELNTHGWNNERIKVDGELSERVQSGKKELKTKIRLEETP